MADKGRDDVSEQPTSGIVDAYGSPYITPPPSDKPITLEDAATEKFMQLSSLAQSLEAMRSVKKAAKKKGLVLTYSQRHIASEALLKRMKLRAMQ